MEVVEKKSTRNCYQCKICLQVFTLLRYFRKHLTFSSDGGPSKCQEYFRTTDPDNSWNADFYIVRPQSQDEINLECIKLEQPEDALPHTKQTDKIEDEISVISDDEHNQLKFEPDPLSHVEEFPTSNNVRQHKSHEHTNKDDVEGTVITNPGNNELRNLTPTRLHDNVSPEVSNTDNSGPANFLTWLHWWKRHKCKLCQMDFPNLQSLRQHRLIVHDGFRYKCKSCPKEFMGLKSLKQHELTAHRGFPYKCELCTKQYTYVQKLKEHKRTKHEGGRYNCELCPEHFTSRDYLKRHKLTVHNL